MTYKRAASMFVALVSCIALSGCLWSSPNEQPMSVTMRDGEFIFHWCGAETKTFQYAQIKFASYSPERTDGVAFQGSGRASLEPGEEFSVGSPPAGIQPDVQNLIPSDHRLMIFLRTGSSENELNGLRIQFRTPHPAEVEGRWLYPSGVIRDEPCGMRGAVTTE
ncbi:hypothetical protein JOD62_002871 [Microbacterium keratanolyticum]|nr:hypothetical protein [Microbacterium keratanolyticum]MBM7470323.1 hypothetical protein [Microbacterium keratanolyticum]